VKKIAIALAAVMFTACHSRSSEPPPASQDALKALGSMVPSTQFDRSFWQREHDANSSVWSEAKRLCQQTLLANYPNCLPVNDIVQADQTKKSQVAKTLDATREQMFERGFEYDALRMAWLPFREMYIKGCVYSPAYPNDPKKVGSTWNCPLGTAVPTGIRDEKFGEEQTDVTQ